MKFEIVKNVKISNMKEVYVIEDKSFGNQPFVNVDINIAMAYLNLGIDSEDMCVKCLWGFSPKESWMETNLDIPFAEEGKLKLKGEYEAGLTWRIDKDKMWESFFDKLSGWYCIGNPKLGVKDNAVKIAKNMIAVVDDMDYLKAVWIKPEFV